ncbi:MAG: ATP-grasp domain-containing protein [Polyangiales bacterium]
MARGEGFPQGAWAPARTVEALAAAAGALGPRAFVKAAKGGYDGQAQASVDGADDAPDAWAALGSAPCVVERRVDLAAELSVLVARSPSGQLAVHPPAQNHHEDRVLAWSVTPAPLPPEVLARAQEIAKDIAVSLSIEGLLVVELFLSTAGELLVNELAPRPHNSFHATEVGNATSQFEQAVRAVCDLPLGSTETLRPAAIANLLGDLWPTGDGALRQTPPWDRALAIPGVRLHLYGKPVARPGRKMGHLSAIGDTPEAALARVREAYARVAQR